MEIKVNFDLSEFQNAGIEIDTIVKKYVYPLFQKMSTEAREAVRTQVFSGELLRPDWRKAGQKSKNYRDMFMAGTIMQDGDIRTTFNVKGIGEDNTPPAGYQYPGAGFFKNLIGDVEVKAQAGSTIRIPTKKAGEDELTSKGSLKKIDTKDSKKYFMLDGSSPSLPKAFSYGVAKGNKLIFRRNRDNHGDNNTIKLVGIALERTTYKNEDGYKLKEMEKILTQYFGDNGIFQKQLEKELRSKLYKPQGGSQQ